MKRLVADGVAEGTKAAVSAAAFFVALSRRLSLNHRKPWTTPISQFYATATIDDRFHFDGLVFAHAAAVMALNIPRSPFPHAQRLVMERDSDKAERMFLLKRDRV